MNTTTIELTKTKTFGLGYRKVNLTKAVNHVINFGKMEIRLIVMKPSIVITKKIVVKSIPTIQICHNRGRHMMEFFPVSDKN